MYILVGKSCCGKSSVMEIFVKDFGFTAVESSTILKELLAKYKCKTSAQLFKQTCPEIVAQTVIKNFSGPKIIVSGFRTKSGILYLKKHSGAKVINICASDKTCYKRAMKRKREDMPKNFEEFYKNTICREYSLGLAEILYKHTDYFMNGESGKRNIPKQIKNILRKQK